MSIKTRWSALRYIVDEKNPRRSLPVIRRLLTEFPGIHEGDLEQALIDWNDRDAHGIQTGTCKLCGQTFTCKSDDNYDIEHFRTCTALAETREECAAGKAVRS